MDSLQAEGRKPLTFSLRNALSGLRAEEKLLRGAEAGVLLTKVAYNITKALCENREILVNTSAVLANFNPEVSGSKALTGCELHPGAARYYAEMGYAHE